MSEQPSVPKASRWIRERVEPGIRRRLPNGFYEAWAEIGEKRVWRSFKPHTPIGAIRRWREDAKAKLRCDSVLEEVAIKFPLSPKGWCYLYCIQDGSAVKFGRAADPHRRLRELQTGHASQLRLVAAIPTHATTEAFVHTQLEPFAIDREWFHLTDEVLAFIKGYAGRAEPNCRAVAVYDGRQKSRRRK